MSKVSFKYSFVVLGYLSLFALAFFDNMRGPYLPSLLTDLSLDDRQGAWFFAMTSAVAFISSWLMPSLILRLGSIFVLFFGLITIAVAALCISISPDFVSILISVALFGVGYGAISVAMNIVVSEGAPAEWRRRILSGLHGVYGLASFFAPLVVSFLATQGKGWRQGFMWAALPGVLFGGYALWLGIKKRVKSPVQSSVSELLQGPQKLWALWMALAVSVYLFGELTLSTRLVLYLMRSRDLPLNEASLYLSVFFGGLCLARFLFLFLKIRSTVWRLIQCCLVSSIILFVAGLLIHPLFLALCGLSLGPFVPAAIEHQMQLFGRFQTQVVAYIMAFFSLVTVVLQFVLGYTTQYLSISVAMWWGPVGLVVSGLIYAYGLSRFEAHLDNLEARITR